MFGSASTKLRATEADPQQELPFAPVAADAALCSECGSMMTRNGSCYKCGNCGGTSGCIYGRRPARLAPGGAQVAPF